MALPDALDAIDVGMLRTFRLVYLNRSFTLTAQALNQNQSSVSYRIDKLRDIFRDPLFVRIGTSIAPTPRCIELFEHVSSLLEQLETAAGGRTFDPANVSAEVTISCNYYQRVLVLPALYDLLRAKAPKLVIRVMRASNHGQEQLRRGEADLVLSPAHMSGAGLFQRKVMKDEYVCIVSRKNLSVSDRFSLSDYLKARHATVNYGDGWKSGYQVELDKQGLHLNELYIVPSPEDLRFLLPKSTLISTLPRRLAEALSGSYRIVTCPLPAPFDSFAYWTQRTHSAELHKWLRKQVFDITSRIA